MNSATRRRGIGRLRSVEFGLVLILAGGFVVALASPAYPCSCAGVFPREALESHEAAFVGRLVADEGETLRFSVEQWVKGDAGPEVSIPSYAGSSCAWNGGGGERLGLFLNERGGRFIGGYCGVVSPEQLLAAAEPLPAPDGEPPASLLIAGQLGEPRVLTLDGTGRTVGFGLGAGVAHAVAACPGGQRSVEIWRPYDGAKSTTRLAVRDLATMEVLREADLGDGWWDQVACRSEDASDVLVFGNIQIEPYEGRIMAVTPNGSQVLFRGPTGAADLSGLHVVYASSGGVVMVDPADGMTQTVLSGAQVPFLTEEFRHVSRVALSPDGGRLALHLYSPGIGDQPPPSRIVLADISQDPPAVATFNTRTTSTAELVWRDPETLVAAVSGPNIIYQFGPALVVRSEAALPPTSSDIVLVNDTLVMGTSQQLLAGPPEGPFAVLRAFAAENNTGLAAIPPPDPDAPPPIEPTGAPVTTGPAAGAPPLTVATPPTFAPATSASTTSASTTSASTTQPPVTASAGTATTLPAGAEAAPTTAVASSRRKIPLLVALTALLVAAALVVLIMSVRRRHKFKV